MLHTCIKVRNLVVNGLGREVDVWIDSPTTCTIVHYDSQGERVGSAVTRVPVKDHLFEADCHD